MASVRMSKDLKASILVQFSEALSASTERNEGLFKLGDKLYDLMHSKEELAWLESTHTLMNSYDSNQRHRKEQFNLHKNDEVVVILCPDNQKNFNNKTQKKLRLNLATLNWWSDDSEHSDAGFPGEVPVSIPLTSEKYSIHSQSLYFSTYQNTTQCSNPITITDIEVINLIKLYAKSTLKNKESVDVLGNFLDQCTTLKKFLDEWPGAENLVPDEYINRMLRNKPKSSQAIKASERTLDTSFKDEMQAAILTAKLS
jgi:hypothetical protein